MMAETKNITSIETLLDDYLLNILRYLSIVERIKIERVNKRWNALSKSGKLWADAKKLDLYAPSWGFRPRGFLSNNQKTIELGELEEVIKRCGKFIECIDVKEIDKEEMPYIIASYCPNVEFLTIKISKFKGIEKLVKKCKNIIKLNLIGSPDKNLGREKVLSRIFEHTKNLRVLKLKSIPKITGLCLLNLENIEFLDLKTVFNLEKRNLANSLIEMNNLKVFKISLFNGISNDVIMALQKVSNLEELSIESLNRIITFEDQDAKLGILFRNNQKIKNLSLKQFMTLEGDCFDNLNDFIEASSLEKCQSFNINYLNKYLYKFINLKKFEYKYHKISIENYYDLMQFISWLTKLKYLKVSVKQLEKPDNDNFNLISGLTDLEHLDLTIPFITDESLKVLSENLKNLKTLCLNRCEYVTDTGLYSITSLPKLENLGLLVIPNITDAGFYKMLNLKRLNLFFCKGIENTGLKKILMESDKLAYFNVCKCSITEDLLLFANEITAKRTNNIVLYVHKCILSDIKTEQLFEVEKSQFLEYTSRDFSFFKNFHLQ